MSDRCENCNAWLRERGNAGLCRANPPTPILLGVSQSGGLLRTGVNQTEPVVATYFPTMTSHGWCRQWEPKNPQWNGPK